MSDALITAAERLGNDAPFDKAVHEARLLLVRGAVERLAWGTMAYRCDTCTFEWEIWLALGVEGPAGLRADGLYVASPFMTRCPAWPMMRPCEGSMSHVRFSDDVTFDSPVLTPDDAPRWVLPYSCARGDAGARLEIPDDALVRARRALNENSDDFPGAT